MKLGGKSLLLGIWGHWGQLVTRAHTSVHMRNFGNKTEILHSMKADVAYRIIRRCIETYRKFRKIVFLINISKFLNLNATSAFMQSKISALSQKFLSVYEGNLFGRTGGGESFYTVNAKIRSSSYHFESKFHESTCN